MVKAEFILDSNILIESKNIDYPFDFCPGFWDLLEKGFNAGIIVSHEKVLKEINVTKDELTKWVTKIPKSMFQKATDDEITIYNQLCEWAENNQFNRKAIETFCNNDYADPWICAKAKSHDYTLVTQEVSSPAAIKSIKIPDVCIHAGIKYCDKYEMLRRLNARFELSESHSF